MPDLAPAGLTLVAIRVISGGEVAHYAGLNKCRVTLYAGESAAIADSANGYLHSEWSAGSRYYAMIARGMDDQRFRALETYLRVATIPDGTPDMLAFRKEVFAARRCV